MSIQIFLTSVAAAATVFCAFSASAFDLSDAIGKAPAAVTDRLIVKYRNNAGALPSVGSQMAATASANLQDVTITSLRKTGEGAQVFKLSRALTYEQVEAMATHLRASDSNVEYAEPDRLMRAMYVPNDPLYSQQWDLYDTTGGIRAPAAWDKATGTGVKIAVIDTGVRPHADLVANLLPGYNFISDPFVSGNNDGRNTNAADYGDGVSANYCGTGSRASNSSWHGTHVSGIVAATANNGAGVVGVAFNARVVPLRVLGRCGGYTSDIADAIVWAAGLPVAGVPVNANPAKILSMSLGGDGFCGATLQNAITSARAKGSVVIVAAGNSNADASTTFPANCTGVVAVAATGISGAKASYSNFGSNVTLAAPGGDSGAGILSTLNAGTLTPGADSYASYMGTSMATPVVSGVVALMLSVNSNLTPDQITSILKASARPFPGTCVKCGAGIVDASAAVALAASTPASAPTPTPAPAPAPTPTPVVGNGVNHTLGSAQLVARSPALVTASLTSDSVSDYFLVTVLGRGKLNVSLTAGVDSGFGLSILTPAPAGQQLYIQPGVVGQAVAVQIANRGATTAAIVIRVFRTAGALGTYQVLLAP